jgi:hypothetical protein
MGLEFDKIGAWWCSCYDQQRLPLNVIAGLSDFVRFSTVGSILSHNYCQRSAVVL